MDREESAYASMVLKLDFLEKVFLCTFRCIATKDTLP